MRGIRKTAILGAVTTVALLGLGTGTALADPPSGTTPALTDIVGVGSDTITPLFVGSPTENTAGSLSFDYNHQSTVPANKLWSFDAVNPSSGQPNDEIITKASGAGDTTCQIARPNGSSAGITALENTATDGGHPCVDFARSSRAPQSTDPSSIDFVSFAKDAIDWASPAGTAGHPSPAPATLTFAQLVSIYTCVDTNWDQVGGANAPIVPVIPQAGSGTRATFLLALGGGTTPLDPTKFPCIVNGSNSAGVIEENTGLSAGNVAQFDPNGVPAVDDIFPYSIGDWIAQITPAVNGIGGHATSIWGHGVFTSLPDMTDTATPPVQQVPIENLTTDPTINPNWISNLQRLLYNVVDNAGSATAPQIPANLQPVFAPAPTGWICSSTAARNDILSYGFLTLRTCGAQFVG